MSYMVEYLLAGIAMALFLSVLVLGAQFIRFALIGKLDVRELVCRRVAGAWILDVDKCWLHVFRGVLVMAMLKDATTGQPSVELQSALFALGVGHEIARRITKKPDIVADRRKGDVQEGAG